MLEAIKKFTTQTPTLTKIHKMKERTEERLNTGFDLYDTSGEVTQSVLIPAESTFFSLLDRIGSGAYGVIRRSLNLATQKLAVVKIQDIQKTHQVQLRLNKSSDTDAIEEFVQLQLETEENLTKALGRFYGALYRVNAKGVRKKYLFMEFFEGKNLYERTKQGFTLDDKLKKALEITTELQNIHALHYVHMDLSLHNTIDNGQVKIIDFGCSSFLNGEQMIMGEFRGTHIPPEMFKQHEDNGKCTISAAVDVFALGMIIYEIFSSNVFDPYKYDAYDEYKAYYQSFYQTALQDVTESPDEEPWKKIVRDMINENPENRISVSQTITLLNNYASSSQKMKCN